MSAVAPRLAIEIFDGTACFRLRDEWEALLQRGYDTRIFLTPTWFEVWLRHFSGPTPFVLVGRSASGHLEAVLPLQTVSRGHRHVLSILGDHNVSDYMDGVADKVEAEHRVTELLRVAFSSIPFDDIDLRHIPSNSPLISGVRRVCADLGRKVQVEDDDICPVAILCNSWGGYLQMLSKKQRHEIRRKMRRTLDGTTWSWHTASTLQEVGRHLETFFRLHASGSVEKSTFMTDNMRAYFADLAMTMHEREVLRLSVLTRNGQDVAATMGFSFRGRYMLYNSGYDVAYAACNPGITAVALMMQDAIREGAIAFDFLSGNEPYKYQFGASDTRTCRVSVGGEDAGALAEDTEQACRL